MRRRNTPDQKARDDLAVKDMVKRVNEATSAFEAQWSMSTLRLCDPELHSKLVEQLEWFHESAVVSPDYMKAIEEGEASLRGLAAATERMDAETEEVMIWSEELGAHLVVKHHRGQDSDEIVITPAEVLSWLLAHPSLIDMKRRAPGCEIAAMKPKEQ